MAGNGGGMGWGGAWGGVLLPSGNTQRTRDMTQRKHDCWAVGLTAKTIWGHRRFIKPQLNVTLYITTVVVLLENMVLFLVSWVEFFTTLLLEQRENIIIRPFP